MSGQAKHTKQKGLKAWAGHFEAGGRWEKYYPVYEMIETIIYWTDKVTPRAPHIRDAIDIKRVMTYVVLATFPCVLMSWYNTGYQANIALEAMGVTVLPGWRGDIAMLLGIPFDANSTTANMALGFIHFLPVYLVTLIVGGLWEVLFAVVRGHEVNEGFFVTSILYTLTLPPDIPLWLVALGISFGVVIGKEVFGGTGKNFLNPALTGRAFLYFAYPGTMSGNSVWVAADGYSRATPLGIAASEGLPGILADGYTWWDSFIGLVPGSLGETSTLACLLGGAFLVMARIASWRIISGVFVGMVAMSFLLNQIGSELNPMFALSWEWHLVTGGFAFGMVFMATDPVSAAATNAGRWIFGVLIGVMAVLIRVLNPAFPEGMMLAILFGNIFAPVIDYLVVKANCRRRMKRYRAITEANNSGDSREQIQ